MKFIKTFNESVRPYTYLKDNSLFKYILMIDSFDMDKDNFDQGEREVCIELIQDWIYNFTSNTISGFFKTPVSIEANLNNNFIFYLSKYEDDYYLIKAILEIRGNRVPICVVVDSIDGLRMWSKTNPLEFIEEWGSLKENVSNNPEDQFFKKIKFGENFEYRKNRKQEPLDKNEISKIVETLEGWRKKLMRIDDPSMLFYRKIGPRSNEVFILKLEDEWFLVQHSATEPQNWRNRRTGRTSLVETQTVDDYYICDQLDGLIYLLNKLNN